MTVVVQELGQSCGVLVARDKVVALIPITWLAERRCISGARVKLLKSGLKFAEKR